MLISHPLAIPTSVYRVPYTAVLVRFAWHIFSLSWIFAELRFTSHLPVCLLVVYFEFVRGFLLYLERAGKCKLSTLAISAHMLDVDGGDGV